MHAAVAAHAAMEPGVRALPVRSGPALAGSPRSAIPVQALVDGCRGFQPEGLLGLQRLAGNQAVLALLSAGGPAVPAVQRQDGDAGDMAGPEAPPALAPIVGQGEPEDVHGDGGCDGLVLHGSTDARFDGGRFHVDNQTVSKGEGCTCPPGVSCLHVTGTLVTDYGVSVTITMPSPPSGLTDCEQGKVQAFLQNVLAPHEQDHKTRLETYRGQTSQAVDVTGCGQADVQAQIKAIQGAENAQRKAAARALSDAIDPFTRTVDCSDCTKDAGADGGTSAPGDGGADGSIPDAGGGG
jgi:hypothetical protein